MKAVSTVPQEYSRDCRDCRWRSTSESHRYPDMTMAGDDRNLLDRPYPKVLIRSRRTTQRRWGRFIVEHWLVCHRFQCRRRSFRRQLERRLRGIDLCWRRSTDTFYLKFINEDRNLSFLDDAYHRHRRRRWQVSFVLQPFFSYLKKKTVRLHDRPVESW